MMPTSNRLRVNANIRDAGEALKWAMFICDWFEVSPADIDPNVNAAKARILDDLDDELCAMRKMIGDMMAAMQPPRLIVPSPIPSDLKPGKIWSYPSEAINFMAGELAGALDVALELFYRPGDDLRSAILTAIEIRFGPNWRSLPVVNEEPNHPGPAPAPPWPAAAIFSADTSPLTEGVTPVPPEGAPMWDEDDNPERTIAEMAADVPETLKDYAEVQDPVVAEIETDTGETVPMHRDPSGLHYTPLPKMPNPDIIAITERAIVKATQPTPRDSKWTARMDLTLAEELCGRGTLNTAAGLLGRSKEDCRSRWDVLLPVKGIDQQKKLLIELRRAAK